MRNGCQTTDDQTITNEFNQYFAELPITTQANLQRAHIDYDNFWYMVLSNDKTIYFFPITVPEIIKIISNLDSKKSSNDISPKFLKLCKHKVSPILCELFNRCLNGGVYPTCLKIAQITPIHKKGDRTLVSNYSPISVLHCINKIFEKVIFVRLNGFLEHCGTISSNQFGFRKNKDTQLATLELL